MNRIFAFVMLLAATLFSAIDISINSGNPACPFPQFVPYVNSTDTLYNLASKSPVGVSHAEMEKSIREAYRIMMNRASKPGGGVGGKDYIRYTSSPQCSEGDGYVLLAAAALADKETFDGLWLCIHDFTMNKVKSYKGCTETGMRFLYSQLPGWTGIGDNSAADGDFDIALALLYAYRQWGEFMGINDGCGNPVSYKLAAIDFITALTDTFTFASTGTSLLSGDIGLDGYVKGGDSWAELTGWAKDPSVTGFTKKAEQPGPNEQYFDYYAPAYFVQFADFLAAEDPARYAWNIRQFRRAAASSDWLMGRLLDNPKNIPMVGRVSLSASTPIFSNMSMGEDFRLGWRTILNRVWNGNPEETWDPTSHQVLPGIPNTTEQDAGIRFAKFLWDARQAPWSNGCATVSNDLRTYWGPSMINADAPIDGNMASVSPVYRLNWLHGAGSPSAIVARNFNLMAEMYRQCEIEFDAEKPGDGYLTSVPVYFHDWFRLLGMLVLTGNYLPPSQVKPSVNLKIYADVDKTCALPGESVTYTLTYRNFGSMAADGAQITAVVPSGSSFVSSTPGGSFSAASQQVTWDIGAIPGYSTGGGAATGSIAFTVAIAATASGQLAAHAAIRCNNGSSWRVNEFPNTVSAVCKRNFVDIVSVSVNDTQAVKPLPILHGGRPGVHFSFARRSSTAESGMETFQFRMFNDAQEPYIDYGNYRFSIFLYDTTGMCMRRNEGCENGWSYTPDIIEGIDKADLIVKHELLTPGADNRGKWNQRLIVQLADPSDPKRIEKLWTTTLHLKQYFGLAGRKIHRGGTSPLRVSVLIERGFKPPPIKWDDDWSWNAKTVGMEDSPGYPITPDFTDPAPGNPGIPVNRLSPKQCETTDTVVDNILVEEWDGYVWRKVFGSIPQIPTSAAAPVRTVDKKQLSFMTVANGIIGFSLNHAGTVKLQLLDLCGRVIAVPANGQFKAGTHRVKWTDETTATNVYIARLTFDGQTRTIRVLSLR